MKSLLKYLLIFLAALSYFLFLTYGLGYVFGDTFEWVEYGSKGSWDYFWNHPRWDRPGFLLMHLVLFPLFGWNIFGYYLVHGLFFASSMMLFWLLARKLMSEVFALLAVVFVATAYDAVVHPFLFIGDAAGIEQTFVLLGMLCFVNYYERNSPKWLLASALAFFSAMAFKQPSRFMPLVIILFLLIKRKHNILKDYSFYAMIAVLGLSSILFYQAPYHSIAIHLSNIKEFGKIIALTANIFLVSAVAPLAIIKWKNLSQYLDMHILTFIWLIISFLQLPLFPHTEPRYLIGFMLPLTLIVFSAAEKGFLFLYKTHRKTSMALLVITIIIGMYPNLYSVNSFVTNMKPYLIAKEDTRLFLESNISNSLVLYHWGNIDFFGRNNEYRNYNPAITGTSNLSAHLLENKSIYIIHYPRKQPEIERIENKTLYKKIANGPVEFWVWKIK